MQKNISSLNYHKVIQSLNYLVSIVTEFVEDSEFNWQYASFFKIGCDARGPLHIIDEPDSSIETLLTIWSIGVKVIAIIEF